MDDTYCNYIHVLINVLSITHKTYFSPDCSYSSGKESKAMCEEGLKRRMINRNGLLWSNSRNSKTHGIGNTLQLSMMLNPRRLVLHGHSGLRCEHWTEKSDGLAIVIERKPSLLMFCRILGIERSSNLDVVIVHALWVVRNTQFLFYHYFSWLVVFTAKYSSVCHFHPRWLLIEPNHCEFGCATTWASDAYFS